MWLLCKETHCLEISIHKILFFFFFQLSLQNSTFRHKHTQNWWQKQGGGQHLLSPHHHGGGMCRGWLTAWPEIIESWIRLCLGVQRHIWVMTERERQRERERAAGDKDRGQAVSGQAYISSTQSVAVTVGLSAALKSAWTWNKPRTETVVAAAAASGWHTFTVFVVKHTDFSHPHCQRPPTLCSKKKKKLNILLLTSN